jgi:hypothetical protein
MANFDNPLNNLKIASPCPTSWDGMYGNDQVRFCGECKLNVYNLSGMTKEAAENLLRSTEGRLCVRYFRRADGTVLTQDCPIGWRAVKKRVTNLAAAACTLVLGFLSTIMLVVPNKNEEHLVGKLVPLVTPTPTRGYLMGDVAYTPSPTPIMGNVATMGAVAPQRVEIMGTPVKPKTALDDEDKTLVDKAVRKLSKKKSD